MLMLDLRDDNSQVGKRLGNSNIRLLYQQEIRICKGTETFAKEPNLEKNIPEVKADAGAVKQKKSTGFCRMSVMAILLRFGCFSAG